MSAEGGGREFAFSLNDVTKKEEMINMFEFYRICAVRVRFMPRQTEFTSQVNSNIIYVRDYNDVNPAANGTELQEYPGARTVTAMKPFSIYLKPRCAQPVWQGLASSGYAIGKPNMWLDTKSPGIQHYGIKLWWYANMTGQTIDVNVTMYTQFKGIK